MSEKSFEVAFKNETYIDLRNYSSCRKKALLFSYLDYNFCNKVRPIGNTYYHIYDLDIAGLR